MPLDAAYRDFVAGCPTATVWHRAELLTCFGREARHADWDAAVHRDAAGGIVAALPYYAKRRLDGRVVVMPAPIRYLGPVFDPAYAARVGFAEAYRRVLAGLPTGLRSFDQAWSPALPPPAVALAGAQFRSAARPTYLVDLTGGAEALARRPNKSMRKRLRRAERYWRCTPEPLTADAHDVLEASVRREGVDVGYRRDALGEALGALGEAGVAHVARHPDGSIGAVSVAIADEGTGYCWLSGSTLRARDHDGGSYVLWCDVSWAQRRGCAQVDFLGSALPGPAENRRQLGGRRAEYPYVYRDAAPWTRALRWWRTR